MGLGLILGKALGGLVGGGSGKLLASAIGGAFGQKIDDRSALKKEWANEANSYIRMAEAARRAGLNPLEVLRAGNPNQVGRISVGTSAAMQNQFDQIDNILTGEYARQQKRDAIQAELAQVELDTAKARLAAFGKPTVGVRAAASQNARGAEGVEGRTGNVTSISALPDQEGGLLADPNRVDFEDFTGRWGESEIAEAFAFPINAAMDITYTLRVDAIARKTGRDRRDIHREIVEGGPEAARRLYAYVIAPDPAKEGTGNHPLSGAFWGLGKDPRANTGLLPGESLR